MSGGSSTNNANQTQNSDDQQNTVTGAQDSTTLGMSRSSIGTLNVSNTIQSIDANAVGKSFDFASKLADGAFKASTSATDDMYKTAKDAMVGVKDAYDTAGKLVGSTVNHAFDFASKTNDQAFSAVNDSMVNMRKAYSDSSDMVAKTTDTAFDKITKTVQSAADAYKDSASQAQKAYAMSADNAQKAYSDTAKNLDDAYKTAKAGEQKMLAAAAMAVVGIVAIKVMK